MGHDHGAARPGARIRSATVLATIGGVEDDPLFGGPSRAQSLSHEPFRETVILVATATATMRGTHGGGPAGLGWRITCSKSVAALPRSDRHLAGRLA
jgi:hypothetical protein